MQVFLATVVVVVLLIAVITLKDRVKRFNVIWYGIGIAGALGLIMGGLRSWPVGLLTFLLLSVLLLGAEFISYQARTFAELYQEIKRQKKDPTRWETERRQQNLPIPSPTQRIVGHLMIGCIFVGAVVISLGLVIALAMLLLELFVLAM